MKLDLDAIPRSGLDGEVRGGGRLRWRERSGRSFGMGCCRLRRHSQLCKVRSGGVGGVFRRRIVVLDCGDMLAEAEGGIEETGASVGGDVDVVQVVLNGLGPDLKGI